MNFYIIAFSEERGKTLLWAWLSKDCSVCAIQKCLQLMMSATRADLGPPE